ncbi:MULTISPECIES: hypothetical protein [Streptomyces]|uniref:hypothetical protein n=1 Tax=Streptomyces TaxID=1883 RepID=UPI000B1D005A|nr:MULTISPECIES: hypothetical protein [Streptomyces]
MPERILTTPGNTDQCVLTERPAPTLTDCYRPLPNGMDHTHLTAVPVQVRTGDVNAAFFTDGPNIRCAEHAREAFTAHPRPFGACPVQRKGCEGTNAHSAAADRYLCLVPRRQAGELRHRLPQRVGRGRPRQHRAAYAQSQGSTSMPWCYEA